MRTSSKPARTPRSPLWRRRQPPRNLMADSLTLQKSGEDPERDSQDATLKKLERWGKELDAHWGDWITESKELFNLIAGRQWSEDETRAMKDQNKVPVVFNRTGPVIDAVSGAEILGRQEVQYFPRTLGDTAVNEIITRGAEWIRDRCDAPSEESAAARDTFICGLGYTETRMDYEENPKGQILIESGEAMKCLPDPRARKPNARDARYLRYRNEMAPDEFEEMYPGEETGRDTDALKPLKTSNDPRDDYDKDEKKQADTVSVDLWQWYETEIVVLAPSRDGTRVVEYSKEAFDTLQEAMREAGYEPMRSTERKRRTYWEAIVANGRFLQEPRPLPHRRFRFKFMTGKRDNQAGCWYGLARPMKDPQKWANNFFSMVLHIIRTNAKGGLAIERGAVSGENPVEDQKKFEESWARSDAITWVGDGALTQGRIQPKTPPQIPPAFAQLFEQSVMAIRDTTGVSQEMMGLVEHNQPGVVEHQRKQAGFAILADFFDAFRGYRKLQGELLLRMMKDLPPDTLVRLIGEDGNAKYVPLIMDESVEEYDVVVSDAPSGPNQKERNWSLFMQVLPAVKELMTPEVWLEVLRYSPFPEAFVQKIREILTKGSPDQQAEMMKNLAQQLTMKNAQLDLGKKEADIRDTNADATKKEVETKLALVRPDPNPQTVM